MKLVVFGSHQYQWHMPLFGMMHEKYWPGQKIVYFCDKQIMDLPPNIEFKRVVGIDGDWDWEVNFIQGVRNSLQTIDDKIILLTLADMWPNRDVNQEVIGCLERYLLNTIENQSPKIIRLSIANEGGPDWQSMQASDPTTADICTVGEWEGLTIRSCSPKNIHIGLCGGFGLWPSLWNRELMIKMLVGSTWHHFEPDNTVNLRDTDVIAGWVLPSSVYNGWWPPKKKSPTWIDNIGCYIYSYAHTTDRSRHNCLMLSGFNDNDKKLIKAHAIAETEFI